MKHVNTESGTMSWSEKHVGLPDNIEGPFETNECHFPQKYSAVQVLLGSPSNTDYSRKVWKMDNLGNSVMGKRVTEIMDHGIQTVYIR